MNYKNANNVMVFSLIAAFALVPVASMQDGYAADYTLVDDIKPVFTFTFRDGVEVHEFPVFEMGENYISKSSTSFKIQGVVGESPHLHKALDQAYKYRNSGSFEWDYKYFDVEVDFVRNDQTIQKLDYYNCEVEEYTVTTENDDYESYSSTGFAIVDEIEFLCGGLKPLKAFAPLDWKSSPTTNIVEFEDSPFKFDRDTRTYVTFEFDKGIEKIDFPSFELTSGYAESDNNVIPTFEIEGILREHPLLTEAIERSRYTKGQTSGVNVDFEANVQFVSGDTLLRELDFEDCRVDNYLIETLSDHEEGYTGKRGFATVEQIGMTCIGLTGINPDYEKLVGNSWQTTYVEHVLPRHEYDMGTGPHAIATFTFENGQEVIDFPVFSNTNVLNTERTRAIQFDLTGPIVNSTMLYQRADKNLNLQSVSGANPILTLFDVDIDFMYDDKVVRGLNYRDCRVIDYVIETQRASEENYFKVFPVTNTFTFDCLGYHPNNPLYDAMFVTTKAKTVSTGDLRSTDSWKPGFSLGE